MTDPQPGDFGLTSISGDVGTLIRVGQFLNGDGFSVYEHAFVYVGDGQIVEAEPGGARLAGLDEYAGRPVAWSSGKVGLTDVQRAAVVAAARARVGTPYSALDYFAIAAHRFRLPVPGLRKFIASSGHLICSALVDRCFQDAGVQLFNDLRWNGYVTPAALYELIR